jgi:hypothetical protein
MGARAMNRLLMNISNNKFSLFGIIRPDKTKKYGTFFHEMLTCPILRTYSKRDIRRIFGQFRRIRFQTRFTGITRVKDFLSIPSFFNRFLYWIEPKIEGTFGFYQVFYLTK